MNYILSHTLVYGIIGGVFVYYLGYCKVLQVSIGAIFIGLAFVLSSLWEGRIAEAGILFVGLLSVYTLVQWIMMRFFPHQSQKDVFSPIFTIAAAVFVENALGFIFGASPISIDNQYLSSGLLFAIIICVMGILWYLFQGSMIGKILTAARESHNTTKSLGIPLNPLLFIGAWWWFLLLIGAAWIAVQTEGIKPSDGLFYLIIGVGIMVSAGERGIRGVFVVSGGYALLEYFLFVTMGIPIAYKAGLMLTLILFLLLLKPEGLFSFRRRHI